MLSSVVESCPDLWLSVPPVSHGEQVPYRPGGEENEGSRLSAATLDQAFTKLMRVSWRADPRNGSGSIFSAAIIFL